MIEVNVKGVPIKQTAEIIFEAPEIVVDTGESSVSASSPHIVDGEDESVITMKLVDENREPITGLAEIFLLMNQMKKLLI